MSDQSKNYNQIQFNKSLSLKIRFGAHKKQVFKDLLFSTFELYTIQFNLRRQILLLFDVVAPLNCLLMYKLIDRWTGMTSYTASNLARNQNATLYCENVDIRNTFDSKDE